MTNATMSRSNETSPLAQVSFPRTGKRGVPQQFPRRLYEMLDSETKSLEADPHHPKVIAWSNSGLAFRIYDVSLFSETILPKYFRTKKFSSFQRNLNLVSAAARRHFERFRVRRSLVGLGVLLALLRTLFQLTTIKQSLSLLQYGFSKVRRGEAQAYAHPSFVRDHPESLLKLRKTTPSQRRHMSSDASPQQKQKKQQNPRSVSPHVSPVVNNNNNMALTPDPGQNKPLLSLVSPVAPRFYQAPLPRDDRGKLDLLTFALEHEFAKRP